MSQLCGKGLQILAPQNGIFLFDPQQRPGICVLDGESFTAAQGTILILFDSSFILNSIISGFNIPHLYLIFTEACWLYCLGYAGESLIIFACESPLGFSQCCLKPGPRQRLFIKGGPPRQPTLPWYFGKQTELLKMTIEIVDFLFWTWWFSITM